MRFHVLTLFPEMIEAGLGSGIIGRALEGGIISLHTVNIRQYTAERHGKVDDYPYGGGAGMLMQAQPVYDAHRAAAGGRKVRTVYVTPQGSPFTQKKAAEFAREEELVILCGHYEGIDERVLEEIVTDYVSIGDYVLTGGELPAMVMIDAIARLVPGVLGNGSSAEEESFFNDLLEYPQYSRPEVWREKRVPEVLLSGNHSRIAAWRLERARERTALRRPDLYARYEAKQAVRERLSGDKRNNIHMMESLARGRGEILYTDIWAGGEDILLYDENCGTAMMTAGDGESGRRLSGILPEEAERVLITQPFLEELLAERHYRPAQRCRQVLYTMRNTLPVRHKDIRRLTADSLKDVCCGGGPGAEDYVRGRIEAGDMYGAFAEGKLVGFGGIHSDGRMGMLYVEPDYRRQGIGSALESYMVNRMLERGWTPYGHIREDNRAALSLQEKLGLYSAAKTFCWMEKNTCKQADDMLRF